MNSIFTTRITAKNSLLKSFSSISKFQNISTFSLKSCRMNSTLLNAGSSYSSPCLLYGSSYSSPCLLYGSSYSSPSLLYGSPSLLNSIRWASKKTDKPKVAGWNKSLKQPSKRKGKYYKLKTHKGAAQRWQIVGSSPAGVGLKRMKCGRSHLRRKIRASKKRSLRERVLASSQQRNYLKKLIPYHAKKYSKF